MRKLAVLPAAAALVLGLAGTAEAADVRVPLQAGNSGGIVVGDVTVNDDGAYLTVLSATTEPWEILETVFSPSGPEAGTARRPAEALLSFPLYFALDSDRLTAAGRTAIDAAVTAARKIGATDFAVTGQAVLVGSDAHNIELSLRRAQVVSEALVARGIDPAWITIANQVEVELTVATAGDAGDLAGRRVNIILLKQD
jgi:outer membrane protein OmpA-like peptidoglycan-associated protein